MVKAVALISGGLDSILAAKAVKDSGIDVSGIYFRTPFCLRKKKGQGTPEELAAALSVNAGIALHIQDLGDAFLKIVEHPAHGHGKNMNPCIDCRILMLQKAREFMEQHGAAFLITGEVIGQRAMSQHRHSMRLIDKEAGVEGINVRPLSAKLLDPTVPEQQGLIDRNKLYDFNGRSRQPQRELAVMLNVLDYPNAAGGCLLTDPIFAARLKDLLKSGVYDANNIELLKLGRQYRLSPETKLIVGRDESENSDMERLAQTGDCLLAPPDDIAGPTGLLRGAVSEAILRLSAGILCRYCDLKGRASLDIRLRTIPEAETKIISVGPLADADSLKYRL